MSNSFGELFRITTFGESHGPGVGVVIDGCPPGLEITQEEIALELEKRRPGQSPYVSPRKEPDLPEILSGIFEGRTTGAPITILIRNRDADSKPYEAIKHLYRPGHANYTYLQKYGIFDYRGGGRASARETAARVAAAAVAKKLLRQAGIECSAYLAEVGGITDEAQMMARIEQVKKEGDSIGGIVACKATVPVGLGDPVYAKLEALLASAMLSIPASKGFEIGEGFGAARMLGSEHNDSMFLTNHAGGTLGGISTGAPLYFRVAFKPTSSIKKPQATETLSGDQATICQPPESRHDPCIAVRAVPVVEAMTALVLADAYLRNYAITVGLHT